MAIGKASDLKIYNDQFYSGVAEEVAQNIDAFNAASNGAIVLQNDLLRGDYFYQSVFDEIANLITRRDTTAVTAATDLAMTQDEIITVKINRKIGPVAQTLDAWRKVGRDEREMSRVLGRMVGQRKVKDMVNTTILAVEAAIEGQSALNFDATGLSTKTVTHGHLNSTNAKFGDRAGDIVLYVFHSKPWFDLIGQSITDNVFQVGGAAIHEGTAATFGRRALVIDAPALTDANGSLTDTYNTLGLTRGAVVCNESEPETIAFELVTGLENLVWRLQGEFAYNLGCRGFKWDVANGGANPTDAAVGTTTNWDPWVGQDKLKAGVRLLSQ